MNGVRRAVIDVGTNSVKLLIADVAGGRIKPLLEKSEQTRLGRGFYRTRHLQPDAVAHTARVVADYAATAAGWQIASLRVVATSAARDAINQADLTAAIQKSAGLVPEIISGLQEATWAFQGVNTDSRFVGQPLLIVDVGGGSTQIILGLGESWTFRGSYPMGAVRLLEQIQPADPPAEGDLARGQEVLSHWAGAQVRPDLESALRHWPSAVQLVGTGGTSSLLVSMQLGLSDFDRERIEATPLTLSQVRDRFARLWTMPLAARKQIVGLPPNRADVILTGAAIHLVIMETFGFPLLHVSTRGYRFGALLSPVA